MLRNYFFVILLLSGSLFGAKYPVDSIEYSVSLKTEMFNDGMASIREFQRDLMQNVTRSRLENSNIKLDKQRTISFWDTKDHMFRGQNLNIRLRTDERRAEVTVKYRSPDRSGAENFELETTGTFDAKTEIDRYSTGDVFSRSISKNIQEDRLDALLLLEYFPGLAQYGLTPDTEIEPVNGIFIDSVDYELGKYRFGGKNAKRRTTTSDFDLSLWRCGDGKLVAAEVSWKIRNEGVHMQSALDRATEVMEALVKNSDWIDENPSTKTSSVYDGAEFCQ